MSVQAMSWVLRFSKARLGSRLVLLAIADCADAVGCHAWPSVASIAEWANLSEREAQRSIQTLQSLGELEIYRGLGRNGTNYFVLAKMARPHCWYCGIDLGLVGLTHDHQIAVENGGKHELKNLVYACAVCNSRKGTMSVSDFRIKIGVTQFYGESKGCQFVTRPGTLTPDNRRKCQVTNPVKAVSQMSPDPSLREPSVKEEPSFNRPSKKEQREKRAIAEHIDSLKKKLQNQNLSREVRNEIQNKIQELTIQ